MKRKNNYLQCIPVPENNKETIFSYNGLVAQDVGIEAAVLYKFILNSIRGSRGAKRNIAPYHGDDYYWCYNSLNTLHKKWFPHITKTTIYRALKKLEEKRYIVSKKGGSSEYAYDKTTWYTIIQPEFKVQNSKQNVSKNRVFQNEKQVFQNEIYLFQNEIQRSQNGATIPLGNTLGNTLENSIKEIPQSYIGARAPESVINFGRRVLELLSTTEQEFSYSDSPQEIANVPQVKTIVDEMLSLNTEHAPSDDHEKEMWFLWKHLFMNLKDWFNNPPIFTQSIPPEDNFDYTHFIVNRYDSKNIHLDLPYNLYSRLKTELEPKDEASNFFYGGKYEQNAMLEAFKATGVYQLLSEVFPIGPWDHLTVSTVYDLFQDGLISSRILLAIFETRDIYNETKDSPWPHKFPEELHYFLNLLGQRKLVTYAGKTLRNRMVSDHSLVVANKYKPYLSFLEEYSFEQYKSFDNFDNYDRSEQYQEDLNSDFSYRT